MSILAFRRPAGRSPRRLLRPLSVLGVAALAASALTACGSSSSGNSQTLVIAEWTNAAAVSYTQKIDSLFEKEHPGVTVNLETAPTAANGWPSLEDSLLAAKNVDLLAEFPATPSGFFPSYTKITPGNPAALVTSHQLLNLANEPFMKYYNKSDSAYSLGYNGGIYGVTAAEYVNNGGMWYKPALLAKYHMQVPTTFNQFMADAKVLKANGITPVYVSGKDGYQNILFAGIYNQLIMQDTPSSDATSVSMNRAKAFWNGTENWTNPVYETAAQEYEEVMQYIEPAAAGVSAATAPGEWAVNSNNYPFFIDGSYDGNTITQANPSLSLGFFAFPGTNNPSWNRVPTDADLTWTVPVWAKHQTLALEWLDLFSQPSNYAKWLQATGSLSTETSVPTPALPWTSWLSAHASNSYQALSSIWVPTGAADGASEPDTILMQPIGNVSAADELQSSASNYTKSVKG
jgi:raffinose/stachyose/melibiose transport system substrate-binding protein